MTNFFKNNLVCISQKTIIGNETFYIKCFVRLTGYKARKDYLEYITLEHIVHLGDYLRGIECSSYFQKHICDFPEEIVAIINNMRFRAGLPVLYT